MLYFLVRPVARYVLRYYYRRIDIRGLEHIPRDGAVILAANHPTAFIEPCLLACFQQRPLHFLARGDLYKTKLVSWVLRALHILPVYRIQDGGYSKLTENYATFDACYGVMSRGGALMVLAEGRCVHEKRLRPLRKGTARVALGALDRDATLPEVYIVPVGVNFVAAERVRSDVLIRCGEPLRTSDFLKQYRENEAVGLRELTAALRKALSPHVLQLPEAATDARYEVLLELHRTTLSPGSDQLSVEQTVVARGLPDTRVLEYRTRLQQLGLTDGALMASTTPVAFPWSAFPAVVLLLPQLPVWTIAQLIALIGPKTIEFYSPVRFAAVAVGTLLYLPLWLLLSWPAAIYLLLSLVFTRWAIRQLERAVAWYRARKVAKYSAHRRRSLLELRAELVGQ